jgi:hypothetical protein
MVSTAIDNLDIGPSRHLGSSDIILIAKSTSGQDFARHPAGIVPLTGLSRLLQQPDNAWIV